MEHMVNSGMNLRKNSLFHSRRKTDNFVKKELLYPKTQNLAEKKMFFAIKK